MQDAVVDQRYASGRLSEIGKVSFVAAVDVREEGRHSHGLPLLV